MKGFILTIVAGVLFMICAPIGIVWQMVCNFKKINQYFFKIAICIDQTGNVICSKIMDDLMLKRDAYHFGSEDETISSVIGKNHEKKTLSLMGKALYYILNLIEPYHSEKAIEKDEDDSKTIR